MCTPALHHDVLRSPRHVPITTSITASPFPGAKVLFGGKPLTGHSIPAVYGAVQPTAVFVPLVEALKPEHFGTVTTEVFGPFQVRASGRAHGRRRKRTWRGDGRPLCGLAREAADNQGAGSRGLAPAHRLPHIHRPVWLGTAVTPCTLRPPPPCVVTKVDAPTL